MTNRHKTLFLCGASPISHCAFSPQLKIMKISLPKLSLKSFGTTHYLLLMVVLDSMKPGLQKVFKSKVESKNILVRSQTWETVCHWDIQTRKRVENMTCSGVGAIAEYPAQLFTCVGFLWRTRYITIVAILIQWDANGWAGYSAI